MFSSVICQVENLKACLPSLLLPSWTTKNLVVFLLYICMVIGRHSFVLRTGRKETIQSKCMLHSFELHCIYFWEPPKWCSGFWTLEILFLCQRSQNSMCWGFGAAQALNAGNTRATSLVFRGPLGPSLAMLQCYTWPWSGAVCAGSPCGEEI